MYFSDKVNILESYDDFELGAVSFSMPCPAVVVLRKYVNITGKRVGWSRTNVFSRDYYTCQYCGIQPGHSYLTFDHVLPRSRGGLTTWTNIVTCCHDCNGFKDDRTPEEARMRLLKEPTEPESFQDLARSFKTPDSPALWDPYLS